MKNFFNQFGGSVTPALLKLYEQSDNWKDGRFQNFENTPVAGNIKDLPGIIYKQLTLTKGRVPVHELPIIPFDEKAFLSKSNLCRIIWYGHSVVLMRIENRTILIDPMLGPNTTPIAPFPTRRFSKNTLDLINKFPEIDLMLLSHDHYDHLDLASILQLRNKTRNYFVALGIKRHLVKWGVDEDLITEFDWRDIQKFDSLKITFTPTRHFSGRGLRDRFKSLWGGWIIDSRNEKIWFSGDGGYGDHFKQIGRKEGPFDFAFMECGQYNDDWRPLHLFPEEAVQAAIDAGVKKAMPVHWGAFPLSYQHTWKEPPTVFAERAKEENLDFTFPLLGQIFDISTETREMWWQDFQ